MAAKGYHSYRGRRSGKRLLLIVLLALVLAAALAFWYVQSSATYTDDGQVRFDLPFLRRGDGGGDPDGSEGSDGGDPVRDMDLTIGEAEDLRDGSGGSDDGGQNGDGTTVRRLLELDGIPEDAAALEESLAQAEADGFALTVRDDTGRVYYASAAAQPDAAAKATATGEDLAALCAGESYAVARFNCFRDSYFAYVNITGAGVCRSGGRIWADQDSYYWLDPDKDLARNYVISLAAECAEMGFDELLLEDMCYPSRGDLSGIDYSGNARSRTEDLVLFLTELRAALEPRGTGISLLLTEELIEAGNDADSGQDLAALLPLTDAVYARVDDVAAAEARLAELCPENTPDLVPLTGEAGEGSFCIAAR